MGCTFTIEHRQTGEVLFEIGSPDDSGTNLALKMLKPRNSHPNHSTWPLMFKNVYYLGTSQINPEGFEVRILNIKSFLGSTLTMSFEDRLTNLTVRLSNSSLYN